MAQSRKHKSKREAGILVGSRVITRGAGGGQRVKAKVPVHALEKRAEHMREQRELVTVGSGDKARQERVKSITARVKAGGGLKVVKRG